MKKITTILICILCLSCCTNQSAKPESDLNSSNIVRITERMRVMLITEWLPGSCSEDRLFILDDVATIIETQVLYRPNGTSEFFFKSGSEGLIQYSDSLIFGFSPFYEEERSYNIQLDTVGNYILDKYENKSDTIRKFVIFEEQKIIMSTEDYVLFKKMKSRWGEKPESERITMYHYETE